MFCIFYHLFHGKYWFLINSNTSKNIFEILIMFFPSYFRYVIDFLVIPHCKKTSATHFKFKCYLYQVVQSHKHLLYFWLTSNGSKNCKTKISSPKLCSIGDFNAVMSLLEKNVDDHFFCLVLQYYWRNLDGTGGPPLVQSPLVWIPLVLF